VPLKSGEGRYVAAESVLDELEGEGRVVFRYRDNLNGSMRGIAGVSSANGRVVGLMQRAKAAGFTRMAIAPTRLPLGPLRPTPVPPPAPPRLQP